jgi:hypothetical protein
MTNVSNTVVDKIETHILYATFYSPENSAVYEMMWKNIVEPESIA